MDQNPTQDDYRYSQSLHVTDNFRLYRPLVMVGRSLDQPNVRTFRFPNYSYKRSYLFQKVLLNDCLVKCTTSTVINTFSIRPNTGKITVSRQFDWHRQLTSVFILFSDSFSFLSFCRAIVSEALTCFVKYCKKQTNKTNK